MANTHSPVVETDSISSIDEVTDRVSPGSWNQDDVMTFIEEVSSPRGGGANNGPGMDIQASEPLQSRVSSLSLLLEGQRNSVERSMVKTTRSLDPVQHDKLAKQISDMYLNHELALKLIGKLQQGLEALTKLQ